MGTKSKDTFYPGDLRNRHGATETAALIAAGTYRETADENGMSCYESVKKTEMLSNKNDQGFAKKRRNYTHV